MMDKALLSISPAGRCQLLEMLITLEQHGTFGSHFIIYFNLVEPLVCKTVTRLLGEFKT